MRVIGISMSFCDINPDQKRHGADVQEEKAKKLRVQGVEDWRSLEGGCPV